MYVVIADIIIYYYKGYIVITDIIIYYYKMYVVITDIIIYYLLFFSCENLDPDLETEKSDLLKQDEDYRGTYLSIFLSNYLSI